MNRHDDPRFVFDLLPAEREDTEEQSSWRRRILRVFGKEQQEAFLQELLTLLYSQKYENVGEENTETTFETLERLFGAGVALHLSAVLNTLGQNGGALEQQHPLWKDNPARKNNVKDHKRHHISRRQEREYQNIHKDNPEYAKEAFRHGSASRGFTFFPASEITKSLLHECQIQFGLKDVWFATTCEDEWLRKQIIELKMGLSHLASMLHIPEDRLGKIKGIEELSFYFYQHAETNVTALAQNTIVVGGRGYSVARLWASWRAARMGQACYGIFWEWSRRWKNNPYIRFRRQVLALDMFKRQFRHLVDHIDLSSDAGDKVARRYRAFGKWTDDVLRGTDLSQIAQGWHKVKTGNRIAWTGSYFDPRFLLTWQAHERDIEHVFWKNPRWDLPAWTQRDWDETLSPRHIHKFIGLGFEAWVREHLEHDSWLARDSADHPLEEEAEDMFVMLQKYLIPVLIDS